MKLTIGFSPCPNDTFIFDALIHNKVDTEGLSFEVFLDDVESLNKKAFESIPDICKLSYHAYAYAASNYQILNAGSALGFGVGPLVITKDPTLTFDRLQANQEKYTVAIPGKYTTANFLLGVAFPNLKNKTICIFSEIEEKVLNNEVDCGLIIHENRFTYQEKGLHKVIDLGDFWEKESNSAIPLGGIAIHRRIDRETQLKVDRVLKRSIAFARKYPESSRDYVRQHSQEMEENIVNKHIELYVNDFSLDLGKEGQQAIRLLFEKAKAMNVIPQIDKPIFLSPED